MSLLVTKSGLLTTVQDLGRVGFQRYGVNPGGVMDRHAVRLLNELLENDPNAPVLEMHFPAGDYLFEEAAAFAIGGGDFASELSGLPIDSWKYSFAKPKDVLKFPARRS